MITGNTSQRGVKKNDPLSALLFLMTIEPLRILLRQQEEHGIWISAISATSEVLFADDSTLLSKTPNGVLTQLELVQLYCDGSGETQLEQKAFLLSLNWTMSCPRIPNLTIRVRKTSADIVSVALKYERGHISGDYSKVAIDGKSICAWSKH